MAPRKAPAHSGSVVAKFNGSFVVFLSAFQSYVIAKHAGLSILDASFAMCAANAALCWLLSIATGDYSWVDRLWSVVPAFYAFHFAAAARWGNDRTNLMAVLATLWGLRLSYNFARKDGYQMGEQDYRWPELQRRMRAYSAKNYHLMWHAFNATFVAPYQNVLLLLITLPASVAYEHAGQPLNVVDYAAASLFMSALALETAADQQQWVFQQSKYGKMRRLAKHTADYTRGFLTTGLFAYSRHPNFFAEQCLWVAFYLFSVAAAPHTLLNWTAVGAVLLILLFQGSTRFTEDVTGKKYKAYSEYQRTVSKLVPLPPVLFAKARGRTSHIGVDPPGGPAVAKPQGRGRSMSPGPVSPRALAARPTSPKARTPRSAAKRK